MLGVWFTILVKYSSHAGSLVYYPSEVLAMLGVWLTILVKYSCHVWSLVYYISEVFKACLESGLLH